MILKYLLVLILVSIWTLNSFIKKKVRERISSEQLILIVSFFAFFLIIAYTLFKQYFMKDDTVYINFFNNEDVSYDIVLKLLGLSLLGFLASIINLYLLNNYNFSEVLPTIHSLEIVLAILVGYMFLNEKLGLNNIIGGVLIICGILVINK